MKRVYAKKVLSYALKSGVEKKADAGHAYCVPDDVAEEWLAEGPDACVPATDDNEPIEPEPVEPEPVFEPAFEPEEEPDDEFIEDDEDFNDEED
jgi:hypothetical protein